MKNFKFPIKNSSQWMRTSLRFLTISTILFFSSLCTAQSEILPTVDCTQLDLVWSCDPEAIDTYQSLFGTWLMLESGKESEGEWMWFFESRTMNYEVTFTTAKPFCMPADHVQNLDGQTFTIQVAHMPSNYDPSMAHNGLEKGPKTNIQFVTHCGAPLDEASTGKDLLLEKIMRETTFHLLTKTDTSCLYQANFSLNATPPHSIRIIDSYQGKIMLEENQILQSTRTLDLGHLPNGVYSIEMWVGAFLLSDQKKISN